MREYFYHYQIILPQSQDYLKAVKILLLKNHLVLIIDLVDFESIQIQTCQV